MMISANATLPGSYDYGELARSVFIAAAASYVALDLTGRVSAASGRARLAWLSGGAIAMGIGIWAMHIKGMLAFRLPVPVRYSWPTILAALVVAVIASAIGLYVASRQKMGLVDALMGCLAMGAGIAGVHYLGMAAMRLPAVTRYSPVLVTLSILLAAVFALIALLLAFGLREETKWTVLRRLGAAIVMGSAISAMHYTAMAAASFIPASPPDLSHAVNISPVGNNGIVIVTLIAFMACMVTASVDRRAGAEVRRRNEDLERRVEERTRELVGVNEELRKLRDELWLVVDTIPQQIWSATPEGYVDFCNERWRSYVGLTLQEVQKDGWKRMLHPEEREGVVQAWRESVVNGTPYEREERHRAADGTYRWFLSRAVPLRDAGGHIVRWYGTNTDIKDRKRAEDALRRSQSDLETALEEIKHFQDQLRLVINTIPAMVGSALPDGTVDFVNQRWLEYFGRPLEKTLGYGWMEALHPEDRDRTIEKWRAVLASGEPAEIEARLQRADGEYRWVVTRGVPLRDELGNIVKWYGTKTDIEDRKRAEDELRESEERFKNMADTAPVMIWASGPDKGCTYFNKQWLDFTGRSPQQELGDGWADGVHAEDLQRCLQTYNSAFDRREPFRMEYRLRRADGQFRWIYDTGTPRLSPGGEFLGYIGSCVDITDRKRAEEDLRESEMRLRAFFKHSPNLIFMKDPQGRYLYVNQEVEGVLRITEEEIKGKRDDEVFPPERAAGYQANDCQVLQAGAAMEFEEIFLKEDGPHTTIVHKFPLFNAEGTIYAIGGVATDITARKRAEEALRTSEREQLEVAKQLEIERARLIEAQAVGKVGSWELDLRNLEITWTEQTHRIFETDPLHFHPKRSDFLEFVHPEDRARVDAAFEASLQKHAPSEVEYRIVMADGRVKVLDERWRIFQDEQGRPVRLMGTCQDITERKRADEVLQEAQQKLAQVTRIQTMGELAAAIAHEVNQPLTAIVTNANFSLRQLKGSTPNLDELRTAITEIANDGTRASAVISRIRGLLVKRSAHTAEFDINEIIQEVTTLLRNELTRNRVHLLTELTADLPRLQGDSVELQQVLINLIMNAVEAMRLSTVKGRNLLIRTAKNADSVLVQVQDSGPGIVPELRDRIFEPFFTTKTEGTGMGLSISRSIIESHGGQLSLLPVSHGALFQFTLPVARDEA